MKKHIIFLTIFLIIANSLPMYSMETDELDIRAKVEKLIIEDDLDALIDDVTPLIFAVQQNDLDLMHRLIAFGANVNAQALNGSTALLEAVKMYETANNFNVINYLVSCGARNDIEDEKGETALFVARDSGFNEVVEFLLPQNNVSVQGNATPLIHDDSEETEKQSDIKQTEKGKEKESQEDKKSKKTKKQILATMIKKPIRVIESGVKASYYASLHYLHQKNADYQKRALRKYLKNIKKQSQINDRYSPLIAAVKNNDLETVITLLSDPMTDVNMKDHTEWTALATAIHQGNLKIVEVLVNHKGIILDAPSSSRCWTALMEAIFTQNVEIVKLLIEKGANINAVNNLGVTVLILAVWHGTPEIIDLLLSFNADEDKKLNINNKNTSGYTALFYAAQRNNLDLVKKLINLGAIIENESMETSPLNPIHKSNKNTNQEINKEIVEFLREAFEERSKKESAQNIFEGKIEEKQEISQAKPKKVMQSELASKLLRALKNGDLATIQDAIAKGVDINLALNEYGDTLFILAIDNKKINIAQWLIEAGSDINKSNNDEITPLLLAMANEEPKIIQWLLEIPGIDANKPTDEGVTPLIAAIANKKYKIVQWLLETPGIDVNKAHSNGVTPLLRAIADKEHKIVQWLLETPGIDVNKANNNGVTPLLWAIANKEFKIVQWLLETPGIDVNKANNNGVTPLLWAIANKEFKIVQWLLETPGIDVNKANNNGVTPLMKAIVIEEFVIARLLITKGANVNALNNYEASALVCAFCHINNIGFCNDHISFIFLLIAHGADVNISCIINDKKTTILQCVVENGWISLLESILNCQTVDKMKIREWAIASNNRKVINFLDKKEDLDKKERCIIS